MSYPLQIDNVNHQLVVDIDAEVGRARKKFPSNQHLTAALMEEVGELAQAMLEKQGADRVRSEAIQVACVAIRIAMEGDADFELERQTDQEPLQIGDVILFRWMWQRNVLKEEVTAIKGNLIGLGGMKNRIDPSDWARREDIVVLHRERSNGEETRIDRSG